MTKLNSDELSGKMTPEGNDAVEQCPFCCRLNNPGACDACVHFFGLLWDGEIIGSKNFHEFETVWSELSGLAWELEESLGKSWTQLLRLSKPGKDASMLAKLEPNDVSATIALMEIVDFTSGPKIVTDGMLSGEGHSLYIEDVAAISKVIAAVGRIHGMLNGLRPHEGGVSDRTFTADSAPEIP
jgi:hypothetical protein